MPPVSVLNSSRDNTQNLNLNLNYDSQTRLL